MIPFLKTSFEKDFLFKKAKGVIRMVAIKNLKNNTFAVDISLKTSLSRAKEEPHIIVIINKDRSACTSFFFMDNIIFFPEYCNNYYMVKLTPFFSRFDRVF